MSRGKIPVIETFGPTIQGEGMVIGRKTMFVRTAGCDYRCKWCDSAFTWDGSEKHRIRMMEPAELFEELIQLAGNNFDHVTISGGNPALIGEAMNDFIMLLQEHGMKIGLETQGSKWQDWFLLVDDLTISPKPPSSGMETNFEILDEIIARLNPAAFSLKVVVFDDHDFAYAKKVHKRYPAANFYLSVGNANPNEKGDISSRLLKSLDWLWGKVIEDPEMNNVKALPQLHALVWANKRGV
ncbi:7-carboxy-7-deazaguanine synthase QueE [Heyndrickxia ginsengihumi]|uniref:7-carboxy-7-deazaguanine synthase n=1 Tax=Heyndrickxia ginsengihumi TaxID=363870 RepID=A0A0A6VF88_9BACI|nr:7-carboxy-7-deazaguanine synthase QueE [Heyndrickxia ginsengihumi]KHD86910.1 7-carboxy-7-deazaguanine synthase [Heyndrickxia ginsengihumi]MBE6185413.1 7-carboxy-7-deazaguanine synthase QueE [Bacillus sp. (in: firmicutes)]MCM3021926.1 7-carboxy-7-deazaguanine synthase QueE [Heyndrickxia ginsengihumi]NEY20388.1 7-carboxy-7-deazaguanine synthase QueE [Heyndrickxia ginsengihumi]